MELPIASYGQPSRVPTRLVNVYPQATISGKGPVELLSSPGVVPYADLLGPGRGMYVLRGVLYAVAGTKLYSISVNGEVTLLGTVSGTQRLTFAGNEVGELVTSNKYIWNGTSVTTISDPDMPPIEVVDSIDNYIVYVQSGSQIFGCSELNDAGDYSSLDSSTVDGLPDDLITLKVDHRQVILFGTESTEIWWNSAAAGAGFPFERLAGGYLEVGCLAKLGVAKADNSVFWLCNDRTIRRLSGQTPLRVSQHGMEEKLSRYPVVSDCVAFSYAWNGHTFVVFRFPTAEACWALDVSTGEWAERSTYGSEDWFVTDAVECYGKTFVQHALTGDIGYLSDDSYTEWNQVLRREWTYPQVWAHGQYAFHSNLEVTLRTGDAPVGTTPYLHMEVSNDGGNKWREIPRRRVGNIGEYEQKIRWAILGRSKDRVYRGSFAAPAPLKVLATEITVA